MDGQQQYAPQMVGQPMAVGQPMMAMAPGQQPMMMVPQPGAMMVPAGYVVQPILAPDLLSALGRLKGMFIKQKVELLEVITNCETKNRYHGAAWDPQLGATKPKEGRGEELIKFKEQSDCCERIMCGSYRSFSMAMYADSAKIGSYRQGGDPLTFPDAVVLERPFKCTCLCLARPVIKVKHNTLGYIAQIRNPFRVLSRDFTIGPPVDDGTLTGPIAPSVATMGGKDWYTISGTICQPAFWISLPCGDCSKLVFNIYAADDIGKTRPIGYVARVWPGCLKSLATDADNFVIEYPVDATPVQKAAISAVPILIDYLMFENNGQRNGNGGSNMLGDVLNILL